MLNYSQQAEIMRLWQTYAPQMRFMQFISNFINWENSYNGIDVFYIPDERLVEQLKMFCQTFIKR